MFLKKLGAELRSPVPWVTWATVAMAVSIAGPFGSYGALAMIDRVLFWTPVIGICVAFGVMIRALVHGVPDLRDTLVGSAVIAILNCLVLGPLLYLLMNFMLPDSLQSMVNGVEIVMLIASTSLGVCALRLAGAQPEAPADVMKAAVLPRLLRRIEPEYQGEIWAITVRDHYVDVQTSLGKVSLLMRFSDAVEEVDGVPGGQVHRSHWVAWAGVGSVARDGGKVTLQLRNGDQIPVSRANRDKVDARFPPPAVLNPVEVKGAA